MHGKDGLQIQVSKRETHLHELSSVVEIFSGDFPGHCLNPAFLTIRRALFMKLT